MTLAAPALPSNAPFTSANTIMSLPANHGAQMTPIDERYVVITLDETDSENFSGSTDVSKASVPRGTISDHATDNGRTLSIEGLITCTPMVFAEWDWNRMKNLIDKIEQVRRDVIPVTITTGLMTYPKMVLTKTSFSRSGRPSTSCKISLELQEVREYTPDTTLVDPEVLREPERRRSAPSNECVCGGEGENGTGSAPGTEDTRSALLRLSDSSSRMWDQLMGMF